MPETSKRRPPWWSRTRPATACSALALLVVALALGQLNSTAFLPTAAYPSPAGSPGSGRGDPIFAVYRADLEPARLRHHLRGGPGRPGLAGRRLADVRRNFCRRLSIVSRRHHLRKGPAWGPPGRFGAHGLTSVTLRQADGRAVLIPNSAPISGDRGLSHRARGRNTRHGPISGVPAGVTPRTGADLGGAGRLWLRVLRHLIEQSGGSP